MKKYNFRQIERKWQKKWEEDGIYHAKDFSQKKKFYCLIEFPYPSGAGLHAGHVRSHVAIDIVARKHRMQGENVLYPIGWDAFGLPTENFAIKTKKHPEVVTRQNIRNFKRQIQSYGPSFDWTREINTTDPAYYKWTQWIFLKLYNSYYDTERDQARPIAELKVPPILNQAETQRFINEQRLAYEKSMPINWCPSCKIGLANEEVVAGNCERCGTPAEKKHLKQWMLRITKYADRLISDLDTVDYLDKIKIQQINWIGKSTGAEVDFKIKSEKGELGDLKVFTTRPDTLFGCTYMVIAPEHPMMEKLQPQVKNPAAVKKYIAAAARKSDLNRTELNKTKTGVELKGVWAVNPANGKEIPVWMADYVLMSYGTGAIMAVPAHDERDFDFALKFDLEIIPVIKPQGEKETLEECYTGDGMLVNSEFLNGLSVPEAKQKMIKFLINQHTGQAAINFKLRDWVFSRQHYWGEPIPIIKCAHCGNVPLQEKDLPLMLPKVKNYEPTATGESPLANIKKWTEVRCPCCKAKAERETDTMPNWAGSSWYFLRYLDPHNEHAFSARKKINYWMAVDLYNGGMEHTTLHLLYSRFWHKFLFDLKLVNTAEPYSARRSQGMVIAEDGQKMSKSKGNVINPDELIKAYGADTLRLYEMFMGPYAESIPWSTQSFIGSHRFLERVWQMQTKVRNPKTPLLIATANAGKVKEIKMHLRGLKDFKFITLADLETKIKEPKETGKTFAENSLQKAKYYAEQTGYITLSDDSGLSIAAMPKELGVRSSRYAQGNYAVAMRRIVNKLEGFEEKERAANFQSVITLYNPQDQNAIQYEGRVDGIVAEAARGKHGFGYDPIFIPQGTTRTFGEMNRTEKAAYDHRGKAMQKLRTDLTADIIRREKTQIVLHQTIKKVSEDIEELKFNTAVAQLMSLANELEKLRFIPTAYFEKFVLLLAPFVPHMAEELWQNIGHTSTVHLQAWPKFETKHLESQQIELVVQVNGKVREKITVARNISEAAAQAAALNSEKVQKWLAGKKPRKVIFVPGKLVNMVI